MAAVETVTQPREDQPDRTNRRRPFATWVKRLTKFKPSSSGDDTRHSGHSKLNSMRMHGKRRSSKKNNPYPQSGHVGNGHAHGAEPRGSGGGGSSASSRSGSETSLERPATAARSSVEGGGPPTGGGRSVTLTVATDNETSRSINASSVAGTARTAGGGQESRQGGSTFSSPAPSVRSLTTTLTTIRSLANGNASTHHPHPHHHHHNSHHHQGPHGSGSGSGSANNAQTITFNQPFPTTSPASALPAHLAPPPQQQQSAHPTTYTTATANNLLTDNASILTLASSSQRRRRRSFDTDASVRALAPSSLWGGSRESLPLSVLSANVEAAAGATPGTPGLHRVGAGERASLYSIAGVGPGAAPATLQSERNSIYARQSVGGDGASARSGLLGHGRAESITGSAGLASPLTSPLASPMEVPGVVELGEGKGKAGEKI